MKKPDRRVQRTRQLLRDALIELILEKGYDSVTVQDITDRANLGRATFYLHYTDKEQLLLGSLRTVFDDLKNTFGPPNRDEFLGEKNPARVLPFQHALENRDLYRVTLFSEQGTAAIVRGIREYVAASMQERLEAIMPTSSLPYPIEAFAYYMAGAMIALIGWWLERENEYTPEQIADMFYQLTLPTVIAFFSGQQSSATIA